MTVREIQGFLAE
jgi:putative transposase